MHTVTLCWDLKNRQENGKDIFGLFGIKVITIYNRQ